MGPKASDCQDGQTGEGVRRLNDAYSRIELHSGAQANPFFFPQGFTAALSAYNASGATFQELNLQGELATSIYHNAITGGYYLDSNLTTWLCNPLASIEYQLAQIANNAVLSGDADSARTELVVMAGFAHTLSSFIPQALLQMGDTGGVGFTGSPPDSSQMQMALYYACVAEESPSG